MSKLRPECGTDSTLPCPTGGTAYLLVYEAVRAQSGLIAGRLHQNGRHCAIGAYWSLHPKSALPAALIDEVALVNDSAATQSPALRRRFVLKWLRWKLAGYGLAGSGPTPQNPRKGQPA